MSIPSLESVSDDIFALCGRASAESVPSMNRCIIEISRLIYLNMISQEPFPRVTSITLQEILQSNAVTLPGAEELCQRITYAISQSRDLIAIWHTIFRSNLKLTFGWGHGGECLRTLSAPRS